MWGVSNGKEKQENHHYFHFSILEVTLKHNSTVEAFLFYVTNALTFYTVKN